MITIRHTTFILIVNSNSCLNHHTANDNNHSFEYFKPIRQTWKTKDKQNTCKCITILITEVMLLVYTVGVYYNMTKSVVVFCVRMKMQNNLAQYMNQCESHFVKPIHSEAQTCASCTKQTKVSLWCCNKSLKKKTTKIQNKLLILCVPRFQ